MFPNLNGMSNVSSFNSNDQNLFSTKQVFERTPDELLIKLLQQRHVNSSDVERLIELGANVNFEDSESGWTPLHMVVSQPTNTHLIPILIQHGASTDTILEFASAHFDIDNNVNTIIQLDISPISNETVCNLFKYDFKPETIDLAIQHGANIMEPDSIGIYPFEYGTLNTFKYFQNKFNLSYNCSDKERKPLTYYTITPLYDNSTLDTNIKILSQPTNDIQQLKENHTAYINQVTRRDRYILQQYTYVGDSILHNFLIGKDISEEIYTKYLFNFNRNQFIEHRFIEMPYLYSMLDVGEIKCVPQNYLLFFYEEIVLPLLRKQKSLRWFREHTYRFFIDLYNIIQKAPKVAHPFVVYRGIKRNYLNLTKNTLFYLNTFSSTSINRETAEQFGPIQYVMYVHPACDYIYLEDVTVNRGEEEILLNPYMRYIVMDWNSDKTLWHIGVLPSDKSFQSYQNLQKMQQTILSGGNQRKTRRRSRESQKRRRQPHSRLTDPFLPHISRTATDAEIQMCTRLFTMLK
jgi:hypothetical protein